MAGSFPVMRPGMVAIIADGPQHVDRTNEIAGAFGQLGLPAVRHVASPATTPNYVLQLVSQLEAAFARLAFVAVGEDLALYSMLESASSAPVFDGSRPAGELALRCAKIFGLEDTVLFGRTLLMQANARSSVIAFDASLQQQLQTGPPGVHLG